MAVSLLNWWLLLLPLIPGSTFSKPHVHPFYVSVVEVNHNAKEATLEISCKMFAEDVQSILQQDYKTTVDFGQAQQAKKIDGMLMDYIGKHLSLKADGKLEPLHYVGFEREAESLYGYFEVTGVPAIKTLDLTNSLLYDFSAQQINIMHVMAGGVRKSLKLDYPNTAAAFQF